LAFLDEEDRQRLAPEPSDPPRRRSIGPQRRRQQYLVRRLIAVGLGLVLLILVVLGFRGCLEARSDRGLRNYTQDVGTIMAESQQRGEDFFEVFENPDNLSDLELQQQILSLRGASESLLNRAENLDAPGQMSRAQGAVTLALELRRDALGTIGSDITQATADAERAEAIDRITRQMGALYASDILWQQVAAPEINRVLREDDIEQAELPAGNFMPESNPTEFLDQAKVVETLAAVSGEQITPGTHGLGLIQTAIGGTTLTADASTTVPDDSREIQVQIQNQGESEESGIRVVVTLEGSDLEGTIASLGAGESQTVNIPIANLPTPGTEATVEVTVEPVPGESVTDNNQATYTVVFG